MAWLGLSRRSPRPAPVGRYELLTRDRCHLCEEMAALLDAELPRHGLEWTAVAIEDHPELVARYNDVVPVLLRDGQPVAKIRLDAARLQRIVRRRR